MYMCIRGLGQSSGGAGQSTLICHAGEDESARQRAFQKLRKKLRSCFSLGVRAIFRVVDSGGDESARQDREGRTTTTTTTTTTTSNKQT